MKFCRTDSTGKRVGNFVLFFLCVLTAFSAIAQNRTITATVTDCNTGEALVGANVIVQGSSTGTVTDFNGSFTLSLATGENSIVISYVGYPSKTVDVSSGSNFDICLGTSNSSCDFMADFENLTLYSSYNEGDSFVSGGIDFTAVYPVDNNGQPIVSPYARVRVSQVNFGSGQSILINNLLVSPDLTAGTTKIIFEARDAGRALFLRINGQYINFNEATDINGTVLGGVSILATGSNNVSGIWSFEGNIQSFEVGGEELFIDNFCLVTSGPVIGDCELLSQYEDITLGTQYSNGSNFTSDGLTFDVQNIVLSGVSFNPGEVRVSNQNYFNNSGQNINLSNISLKPNLPANVSEIKFNAQNSHKYLKLVVNGSTLVVTNTNDLQNATVGGISITLQNPRTWVFTGIINDFEIGGVGGDGLWIDNFCLNTGGPVECPFDPDFSYVDCSGPTVVFLDTSAGATEGTGYQYQFFVDGTQIHPYSGAPAFNGLVHIFSNYGAHEGRLVITDLQDGCTEEIVKNVMVLPEIPEPEFNIIGGGCSGSNVSFEFDIPPDPSLPVNTEYEYVWNWIYLNDTSIVGSDVGTHRADDPNPLSYSFSPPSPGQYQMILTLRYAGGYCEEVDIQTFTASSLGINHGIQYQYCSDSVTGDITMSVSGGTPPYEYRINGGSYQTSNQFTGLAPGNYNITVKDDGGCEVNYPIEVIRDEDKIPRIEGLCASPGFCSSTTSVSSDIKFTAYNGNPSTAGNYNYQITDATTGQVYYNGSGTWNSLETAVVNNISGGEQVRVVITQDLTGTIDIAQCPIVSDAIVIPQVSVLINVTTSTPIEVCDDAEIVTLNLSARPEILDTTYFCGSYDTDREIIFELQKLQGGSYQNVNTQSGLIQNQSDTFSFSGSGSYRIVATYDQNGFNCSSNYDFIVKKKNALTIEVASEDNSCFDADNGRITIDVSGIYVGDLEYAWEKVGDPTFEADGASLTGLEAGTYQITISDQSDCPSETITVTVNEPTELDKPVIVNNGNQCEIYAQINQTGTPPYDFIWYQTTPRVQEFYRDFDIDPSGGVAISNPFEEQIQPGDYVVAVMDANGCIETSDPITFEYPDFARSYDLTFRWSSVELNPPPEPREEPRNRVTSFSQQALEVQRSIQNQISECRYNVQEGIHQSFADLCFSTAFLNDELSLSYELDYDLYTLYYYDRAGNLVRTISPKGIDSGALDRDIVPLRHSYVTSYDYNSLKQRTESKTPDAGLTKYFYNDLGQLRFSQNERQRDPNDIKNTSGETRYTYSKYDDLSRIVEVGESKLLAGQEFMSTLNNDLLLEGQPDFPNSNTEEETFTHYNEAATGVGYLGDPQMGQRYVDNRIGHIVKNTIHGEEVKTYFSYDPHGNVEWTIQDIPGLKALSIGYKYDLVSGDLIGIDYQKGYSDQFYQRFLYDGDHRIINTSSSTDGIIWDNDARFTYYDHGLLKSIAIGEDNLQKIDYVYTIQNLIKGINHPDLRETAVEGNGKVFGKDLFGMSLTYFSGDFTRRNSPFSSNSNTGQYVLPNALPLFNGNASYIVQKSGFRYSEDPFENVITAQKYSYDLLNRITTSEQYIIDQISGNASASTLYGSSFSFDSNGNLKTVERSGGDQSYPEMDDLTFNYQNGNNKLSHVTDAVDYTGGGTPTDPYELDLKPGQVSDNYQYDALGNVVLDNDELLKFIWNTKGKLAMVLPTNVPASNADPVIKFTYDALGYRIKKERYYGNYDATGTFLTPPDSLIATFYTRSSTGEILSTYNKYAYLQPDNTYSGNYQLDEFTITDLEHRGVYSPDRELAFFTGIDESSLASLSLDQGTGNAYDRIKQRRVGFKHYEIKDHLSNPRVVFTDRKVHGEYFMFNADLVAYYNYYPYGMLMPDRYKISPEYRYAFAGKEKDDEFKGAGNSYDFGSRIYDPRISRFLSTDPEIEDFPNLSPYSYAANTPIVALDKDGELAQFAAKYGIDVGINVATQMLMAYMFNEDVNSFGEAWDEVSMWNALTEGLVDQLGTKKLRMAANATLQIFNYIDEVGMENVDLQGLLMAGGMGLMEPLIGDAIAKYGKKAVISGFRRAGIDESMVKKLTGQGYPCNCFDGETLVYAEEGMIPIERLKIGDQVWAFNTENEEYSLKPIIDKHNLEKNGLYEIFVNKETLKVTYDHPFLVEGEWVESSNLQIGDELFTFGGKKYPIEQIDYYPGSYWVYNLTIDDFETFFVANSMYFVHNCKKTGVGEYGKVGGHHVHAKAGFKGHLTYSKSKGFSISQDFMKKNGLDHNAMTKKQRELFDKLAKSGRPNTLKEHTRIAKEALIAGGASEAMAKDLIKKSLKNLKEQGVDVPTHIPWN